MPANLRTDDFMEHAMHAWGSTVYRLALSQTQSPHDADDVCQDVFLRLLRDPTPFDDDEHLKAWLLRVTINRCHDLHRSAWKRHVDPTDELEDLCMAPRGLGLGGGADGAQDDGIRAFCASDVALALGKLPAKTRLIVHLYYYEGCSTEEVARLVRCLPATVRSRLRRARAALKDLLEQEVPDEPDERERRRRVPLADGPHRDAESGA